MSRSVAQPSVVTRSGTGFRVISGTPARTTSVAMPAVVRRVSGDQTTISSPPKAG